MKTRKTFALMLALCMVLSFGAYASGTPDTSQGGRATSSPPDNSTKAVNLLGTRAAVYVEYGEDGGYTISQNVTDSYEVTLPEFAAPVAGETYTLSGVSILCKAEDWTRKTPWAIAAL